MHVKEITSLLAKSRRNPRWRGQTDFKIKKNQINYINPLKFTTVGLPTTSTRPNIPFERRKKKKMSLTERVLFSQNLVFSWRILSSIILIICFMMVFEVFHSLITCTWFCRTQYSKIIIQQYYDFFSYIVTVQSFHVYKGFQTLRMKNFPNEKVMSEIITDT